MDAMLRSLCRTTLFVASAAIATTVHAAKPTPSDALKLSPVQADVEYDRPAAADSGKCVVDVETVGGITGWVVKTEAGQVLRRFLDTNGDNKVDQWCYFKDGIETYRDIDANFNNKADQYRWLGTAGTRWGLDDDENQRIDSWKILSAEEATAEIVAAFRDKDAARFRRVLISPDEVSELGLSETQAKDLAAKITAASSAFAEVANRQKIVSAKSAWLHFGASRPGVVPAGTNGAEKDVMVYDNVTTVVETDGKHSQLVIGTMIKIGDTWRVFDLPKNLAGEQTAAASVGYFFQAAINARPEVPESVPGSSINPELQKLLTTLDKLDKSILSAATPKEQSRLNGERADLLEKIIKVVESKEDRSIWVRQYAETVSAAMQAGAFPDGNQRLDRLQIQLAKLPDATDLVAFVKLKQMTASYNLSAMKPDADSEKLSAKWLEDLEQFIADYEKSPEAAEAMEQLAIEYEFARRDKDAAQWLGRIVSDFPNSDRAPKAAGAKRRLESTGKSLPLKAKTIEGKPFDLATLNNKVVLIHCWATWCGPCKEDLETIRALQAKYGKDGFAPIGVNLDNTPAEMTNFLRGSKSLPWPQLYETGGMESRLAADLGVLTLPTMVLINRDGKVVSPSINGGELEAALKKLMR
jgi:thiol-disulfide isomerase/thioredoxin